MTAAEFGEAQRQLAIAPEPVAEDQHMAGTVHRLDREHTLVAAFGDEHVLAERLPVARGFPQAAVQQQGAAPLSINGPVEPAAHVVFDRAVERPAFRVPEDAADRLLAEMKQVELA